MNSFPIKPSFVDLCLISLLSSPCAFAVPPADYVFTNGAIYTLEAKAPKAQAVAITGKKLSYVGTDRGSEAYIGKNTKVIDLKGKMLIPGFVESHIHPTLAILTAGADLQAGKLEEVLQRVKAWADAHPEAKVIRGFGWRYNLFSTTGPSKEILDRIFPDRPVLLVGIDGHSAWVNSRAIEIAGIDAKWPDPAPGISFYQRDPKTNEPTGWVVEGPAEQEILSKLDPVGPQAVMAAVENEMPQFAASGITSVFDAGMAIIPTELGLSGYQALEKKGKLPVRIVGSFYWNTPTIPNPVEKTLALRKKFHSELVQVKALKITFDGGEAQHTAVMLQPYADTPGFLGDYAIDKKLVAAAILKAQANNLDTHCHCYGDATTRAYLDAVEAARKAYPNSRSRHTAAHVLFLADQDVARFAQLDVTLQSSAQWAMPDPTIQRTAEIVGQEIAFKEFFRHASVIKAGGRVALGTDWPAAGYVSTYRPLDAIQVAVTREMLPQYRGEEFTKVLPPKDERISLGQALKAATIDAAYVLGLEKKVGSLKAGKLADIVVLEKDLNNVPPQQLSQTQVLLTMMNGKITYQAK